MSANAIKAFYTQYCDDDVVEEIFSSVTPDDIYNIFYRLGYDLDLATVNGYMCYNIITYSSMATEWLYYRYTKKITYLQLSIFFIISSL